MLARTSPQKSDVGAFFGMDTDTVNARFAEDPELDEILKSGKAQRRASRIKRLEQMAQGYWECVAGEPACRYPLDDAKGTCPLHGTDSPRAHTRPNVIAMIWSQKNQDGWADRSVLETKWAGDPRKIPDEDMPAAVRQAFEEIGEEIPPALERRMKELESESREDEDGDEDGNDEPEHSGRGRKPKT